jgi:threonine dehydratase
VNLSRIREAAAHLAAFARPTPLVHSLLLSRELGCELWVKNETVSPIASFKWRGALTAISAYVSSQAESRDPLPSDQTRSTGMGSLDFARDDTLGVVTSSTGNHGQGVAWAAAQRGVRAHVFLPRGANATKRAKIELLGATIHDVGSDLDEAKDAAIAFAEREGLPMIDDGESEEVIVGAGTVGLEIDIEPDVVFVPMGSGSLASGIAIALPNARIVAVQSKGAPAMVESFHARRAIERPIDTIADGLVSRVPAKLALEALIEHVDDALAIPDEELLAAARTMILGAHILVEPSGAAGLAAALRRRDEIRGKRVVVIATGANVTAEVFERFHG